MNRRRAILLMGAALAALVLLACDGGTLISFSSPTATRTRTRRPTFTPRPSLTPTPSDTETPSASETPNVSATPTKRPVATARPVTPKPTVPPPPPPPSFAVTIDAGYFCPQPNDPIWEIIARVNRASPPSIFLGGYVLGIYGSDGTRVGTSEPSVPNDQAVAGLDINCRASKFYPYNAKVDVSAYRMHVPLTIRVLRSKSDNTPISPDFKADFAEPGRYFVEYKANE